MKKVLSLLLALTMVFGASIAVYAAQDDDFSGVAGSRFMNAAPRISLGLSGTEDTAILKAGELVIVYNNNNKELVMPEEKLEPGTEYEYRIYISDRDQEGLPDALDLTELKDIDLNPNGKLRLRGVKGTSVISSAKINKKGSGNTATYRLVINTKENWGTKETDVEYTLQVTGSPTKTFENGNISFKVGYGRYTDDEIDEFGEGDIITISNDRPIILKKQFETLAKTNNYKAIQFEAEDGDWSYLGRVSGMPDSNFKYTRDVVPAIVEKFENQNFEFLTFGAGVTFPTNGEMRIDVADFTEFNKMYTYLYRNGKLTPISTSYDTGSDELVFRTNYLGSFVITDEEITDTTIIEIPGNENNGNEPDENDNNENGNNENPDTGVNGAVNAAAALAVVSLAAAAGSRKKK